VSKAVEKSAAKRSSAVLEAEPASRWPSAILIALLVFVITCNVPTRIIAITAIATSNSIKLKAESGARKAESKRFWM